MEEFDSGNISSLRTRNLTSSTQIRYKYKIWGDIVEVPDAYQPKVNEDPAVKPVPHVYQSVTGRPDYCYAKNVLTDAFHTPQSKPK